MTRTSNNIDKHITLLQYRHWFMEIYSNTRNTYMQCSATGHMYSATRHMYF